MNNVYLSGRLTSDPNTRPAGQYKVSTFGLAVQDAGKKQTVSFFDVEAWQKSAELVGKYFVKGDTLSLQGKLKMDSYTDKKTNQNVKKVKIVVDEILNLPREKDVVNTDQNQDEHEIEVGDPVQF